MAAGQMGGILNPTDSTLNARQLAEANLSFGKAIQLWNSHEYEQAAQLFEQHCTAFPKSPWVAEAVLHIGCNAYYNGRYNAAQDAFDSIIEKNSGKNNAGAVAVVNKAKLRLGVLRVAQDRFQEAHEIFRDLYKKGHDWRHRTYASHWIQRLSRYEAAKLSLLNCGARALAYVMKRRGDDEVSGQIERLLPHTVQGYSMETLSELAAGYGLDLVAVKLPVDELMRLSPPVIVYVTRGDDRESGHYWVLDKTGKDELELLDPQSEQRFRQTPDQFAREWSGIALVIAEGKTVPGARLSKSEMSEVFGGCCGIPRPPDHQGDPGPSPWPGPPPPPGPGCPPPPAPCPNQCGSPTWTVNMININLFMADTPLWYSCPTGPSVNITISYNSQSAIAQNSPFGNKWQFNYAGYVVVDPSGTVTIFMPDGRMDAYQTDGMGGYVSPFKSAAKLSKIADNNFELLFPDGTVYVYSIPRDATGNQVNTTQPFLTAIQDAYKQSIKFWYDSNVCVHWIVDALGKTTSLTYNTQGLVTNISDPFGHSASFQYDSNGNLIQITDMGGNATNLSYDSNSNLTGMQNSRGNKWTFYIEPADGIANGFNPYPAPGAVMNRACRVTVTDPAGGKSEYHYNGGGGPGVEDPHSWFVSPRDYVAYVDYDTNNRTKAAKIEYRFETNGQYGLINSITYPEGGVVTFGYDANGNQTSLTDPNGRVTNFTYNDTGQIASITDPKGGLTQFFYDDNGVDLLQVTNGLGSITYTYNSQHDLTSIQDRQGDPPWSFAFNSYGQMTTVTDPLNVKTEYVYDNSTHLLINIKRDGNVTETLGRDSAGRISSRTDATGMTLNYEYNNLNHLTKITWPDGKNVQYSYAGCCPRLIQQFTDRAGRVTNYSYDALDRLTGLTDSAYGTTGYFYDENGNLIALVDPAGNAVYFTYNLDNRLTKSSWADGKGVTFSYDLAGLLVSRANARGIAASYGYDQNNNILSVSYSDGTPGVTYGYDAYNRVVQRTDGAGTTQFAFDADSRLLSIQGPWGNDAITYQYDKLGRKTGVAVQQGQSVVYNFDTLKRLTQVAVDSKIYQYQYTGVNPLVQSLARPNGSQTNYQYDSLNRLTLIAHKDSSNNVIREYGYSYDDKDLVSGEARTDGNPVFSLQKGLTLNTYNDLNQLTQSGLNSFVYDDDGNMTRGLTPQGYQFQAAYDAENRLKTLNYADSGGTLFEFDYLYKGDGALAEVKTLQNGSVSSDVRYVGQWFRPFQERDANNAVQRQYAWGSALSEGIGGLLHLAQGGDDYSYLYDGRGNVSALLDSSQAIAAAYSYDGFGNILAKAGGLDQPFRFSTKVYDENSGLSYYGYRFYAPSTGRWMTRDPLGVAGGVNLYAFVRNNPTNRIDPLGLSGGWLDPGPMPSLVDTLSKNANSAYGQQVQAPMATVGLLDQIQMALRYSLLRDWFADWDTVKVVRSVETVDRTLKEAKAVANDCTRYRGEDTYVNTTRWTTYTATVVVPKISDAGADAYSGVYPNAVPNPIDAAKDAGKDWMWEKVYDWIYERVVGK
jgi:RHS repeat-associated protein